MNEIVIKKIEVNLKVVDDVSKKEKAIATLTLGCFKIKGFRILESTKPNPNASGEYLWIAPPAYLAGKGWHSIFFCEDKKVWKKIEIAVFKKYKSELSKKEIPIIE